MLLILGMVLVKLQVPNNYTKLEHDMILLSFSGLETTLYFGKKII